MLSPASPPAPSPGLRLATAFPESFLGVAPEILTALVCLAVPVLLWRWGRRGPAAFRRVHRLLALCGLAFAVPAIGWAFAARGEWTLPFRFALPVVALGGAVVFLRRLQPALA
jgi:hypothetical protein